MEEKELYLLALTVVKKVGPVTIDKIISFFGDTKLPFSVNREMLLQVNGLSEIAADEIVRMNPEREAERILKEVRKAGAFVLTIFSDQYPVLLKEIHDPPPVLYCKGRIDNDLKIAVVGTRRATPYGKIVAENLGFELASHGITVVSGLARGVDTEAHRGALNAGGRTIAVLGCGFHHIYPKENRKLADSISENGAVITEFPMEIQPVPENFPRRNRIISGLSVATVIVEAEERSGALITANLALEQGREVFAVPGNITSRKSLGPNRLIKDGATPLIDFDDIFNELPAHRFAGEEKSKMQEPEDSKKKGLQESGQKEDRDKKSIKELALDEDESKILSLLSVDEPMHIDRIADLSRIRINRLLGAILALEMRGLVDQLPGNHYIKKLIRS
ncbi:MAG: DNA-processing protein DprA [Acidobacteriota bacterium]